MHYSDFDEHLHTLVLERGMEYFEKGLVTGLTHSDAGWTASVHGNDEYHIKIEGDDVIQQWYCSCPNQNQLTLWLSKWGHCMERN